MTEIDRTPREIETRENETRKKAWAPPSTLPVPNPEPGYKFRWIRTSMLGDSDAKNVSAKFREGWEPVKAGDYPELNITSDKDAKFKNGVEVGGLLLCKASVEIVEQRTDYYEKKTRDQLQSVDNQYLRENDSRMPLLPPERRTKTTFGSGQ